MDPDLVAALEGEHGAMITALEAAVAAMVAFDADPSDARVAAARDAMAGLSDVLLTHLAHEERDLEPWANARHGTPQIKAAEKAVRKLHPDAGTFFTWVSDDADADVRAALAQTGTGAGAVHDDPGRRASVPPGASARSGPDRLPTGASGDWVGPPRPLLALPGCHRSASCWRGRPRRPTRVVRRAQDNAKPSCHGESVAALVQRRWRPLCVNMK